MKQDILQTLLRTAFALLLALACVNISAQVEITPPPRRTTPQRTTPAKPRPPKPTPPRPAPEKRCKECGQLLTACPYNGKHPVYESFTVNGVSFEMALVEGGTFTMGATSEMQDPHDNEKPTHQVTLPRNYYMGKTEVTQALWKAVMGTNPSYFKGNNRPVECVSWDDCQTFISKLNELTGKSFRLPTEAEWEFAARGGNGSRHYQYSGSNNLDDVAWYTENSGGETSEVATKRPNEQGLYDMSGNVWEWCQDWYGDYSSSAQTSPKGRSGGQFRVFRGGSWYDDARCCRSSFRDSFKPGYSPENLGLRLALSQ